MIKNFFKGIFAGSVLFIFACQSNDGSKTAAQPGAIVQSATSAPEKEETTKSDKVNKGPVKIADAAAILARPQVPILCYHQVRNWKATDSKAAKDYIVPMEDFRKQIKMLADSGYNTILPDQLYEYLNTGTPLPSKPIMLTFDDNLVAHSTIVAPELKKYGFKAVFFVMTVTIGRPNYMSKEQIKALSDEGHIIGSHTWDHHNFKKYQGEDWVTQIEKPSKKLEEITGKPIKYFAYPFGLWNAQGIPDLKSRGIVAAFQLAEKRDQQDPLYTIRRIIASGYWSTKTLHNSIVNSF
jgi:peptidoglycan/xylan/chitin deacetylase (PgdA/CDA1 family)